MAQDFHPELAPRKPGSVKNNTFSRCQHCKCTAAEAMADAMFLGLEREFESDIYSCCTIVNWADEQWQAWTQAGIEDLTESEADMNRMIIRTVG